MLIRNVAVACLLIAAPLPWGGFDSAVAQTTNDCVKKCRGDDGCAERCMTPVATPKPAVPAKPKDDGKDR
jgi:hypothetical protein